MNEKLQEAIAELLGKANNGIDTAGDFLASELPEVIQQLLMWHGFYNFTMFVIGLVIMLFSKQVYNKCVDTNKKAKVDYNAGEEWTRCQDSKSITSHQYDLIKLLYIAPFIMALTGLILINIEWLQIWIAPKVWLIEYAARLAN